MMSSAWRRTGDCSSASVDAEACAAMSARFKADAAAANFTVLSLQIQPDGSVLCQASDFTSARTGLRSVLWLPDPSLNWCPGHSHPLHHPGRRQREDAADHARHDREVI